MRSKHPPVSRLETGKSAWPDSRPEPRPNHDKHDEHDKKGEIGWGWGGAAEPGSEAGRLKRLDHWSPAFPSKPKIRQFRPLPT